MRVRCVACLSTPNTASIGGAGLQNPVVNMLPINGQLWLTIDTNAWGRIDPDTLETIEARAKVDSVTLNAHPACDRATNECFVQHPCAKTKDFPITDQACFSRLVTGGNTTADISVVTLTQATLPAKKTIQHSHSPCITPNYVVAKIDSFGAYHNTHKGDWGMLNKYRQMEDNVWLVMDRRTNASRVLRSNLSFVNNHFWNCFESPQGIVVDAVPATEDYLYALSSSHALSCKLPLRVIVHPSPRPPPPYPAPINTQYTCARTLPLHGNLPRCVCPHHDVPGTAVLHHVPPCTLLPVNSHQGILGLYI